MRRFLGLSPWIWVFLSVAAIGAASGHNRVVPISPGGQSIVPYDPIKEKAKGDSADDLILEWAKRKNFNPFDSMEFEGQP